MDALWLIECLPFKNVSPKLFLELLTVLGAKDVISQLSSGQIIIGKSGERILKAPDFYVAFTTSLDFSVIDKANFRRIGMIQYRPQIGKVLILSSKRWLVESLDEINAKVYVSNIEHGGKTMFNGEGIDIDHIIIEKMREIYQTDTIYPYLDEYTGAKDHLKLSRLFFFHNNLKNTSFLRYDNKNYFFTWAGTKVNRTIALLTQYYLNKQCNYGSFYILNLTPEDVKLLKQKMKIDDFAKLTSILPRQYKTIQKYDYLLSDELLNIEYANTYLDIDSARDIILCDWTQ